jgi:uncharacterized membrane protein (DUF485 family)
MELMAEQITNSEGTARVDPRIQLMLRALRRRVRIYIWLEGITLGLIWLALTFWFGFAIDYLPVLIGANELSRGIRAGLLVIVAVMLGVILYRWILRRTFVRLSDRNMALVLERHFEQFGDSLVTAVELNASETQEKDFDKQMLQHTGRTAVDQLGDVQLHRVFNKRSLLGSFAVALLLLVPIGVLASVNGEMVGLLARRLYLLDNQRWPRKADVQVHSLEIVRSVPLPDALSVSSILTFDEQHRVVRVGRGANLKLIVHADRHKKVPKTCTIHYRTDNQIKGQRNMQRRGSSDPDNQLFTFDEKPFKGIISSLEFDVVGFDDRDGPYRIEVVNNPSVVETMLNFQYPKYTGLIPANNQRWTKGTTVPLGTQLEIRCQSNKRLREVLVVNPLTEDQHIIFMGRLKVDGSSQPIPLALAITSNIVEPGSRPAGQDITLALPGKDEAASWKLVDDELHLATESAPVSFPLEARYRSKDGGWVDCQVSRVDKEAQGFSIHVESVINEVAFDLSLVDTDGITSERPHRVTVGASLDQDPRVDVVLKGIGSAVTPDVVIPVEGTVSDDFGVDRNWFDLLLPEGDPLEFPIELVDGGKIDSRLDLREQRNKNADLEIQPGERLTLTVRSSDRFDLDGDPNIGSSSQYSLEIVTPDQLLSLLERRELGLRQRYELILEEMFAMRDSLERVVNDARGTSDDLAGSEPEDAGRDPEDKLLTPEEKEKRSRSLRLLRVQRAQVQSRKSSQETLGVATAFEDIRAELINNRVDTEDRKRRLQEEISIPLEIIATDDFPRLIEKLVELEKFNGDATRESTLADETLQQTDELLAEMELILEKMLELETYNELIDLVRALISEQEALNEKTKKEKDKRDKDLLKDNDLLK